MGTLCFLFNHVGDFIKFLHTKLLIYNKLRKFGCTFAKQFLYYESLELELPYADIGMEQLCSNYKQPGSIVCSFRSLQWATLRRNMDG
jgi:hypothetical protein